MAKRIELWPIDRLIPYAQNPRTHSDAQVAQIAASIAEFGFNNPVLVDTKDGIIAGHGRLLAARKLKLDQVPVVVLDHLTETQKRAYILADNRLAELAGWDEELLRGELAGLRDADFNLDLIGFDEDELERLLSEEPGEGLTEEDAVPEPLEQAVSRRGDLWVLGGHRLLCGDSANREDVDRLVDGAPVDLVNSDPPYNVRVEPRSNNAIAAGVSSFTNLQHHQSLDVHRHPSKAKGTTKKMRPKDRALENDFMKDGDYDALLRRWFANLAGVLKPGGSFYIWGGYANCANPRTVWACQPVVFMISARVAPCLRRSSSRTSAFLLPSRASVGPCLARAAFFAGVAFLPGLLAFGAASFEMGAPCCAALAALGASSRWTAFQIRVTAVLRSVNFLTGFRSSKGVTPAKLFQSWTSSSPLSISSTLPRSLSLVKRWMLSPAGTSSGAA
jgi:hypothetical protein